MAYDEGVAERLRELFADRTDIVEKKMFGGIAFMLSGSMCCGVVDDTLMARVGPDQYGDALNLPHVREMDFTGRPMKGFIYVSPKGFESDESLRQWVSLCERFCQSLPPKHKM
jgi:hypothetical protein